MASDSRHMKNESWMSLANDKPIKKSAMLEGLGIPSWRYSRIWWTYWSFETYPSFIEENQSRFYMVLSHTFHSHLIPSSCNGTQKASKSHVPWKMLFAPAGYLSCPEWGWSGIPSGLFFGCQTDVHRLKDRTEGLSFFFAHPQIGNHSPTRQQPGPFWWCFSHYR